VSGRGSSGAGYSTRLTRYASVRSFRLSLTEMITRRQAALRLDIPLEMAHRHGIPSKLTDVELAEIERNPPAWLIQSRANRTGKKPVWVELRCDICGFTEATRPKKWWPAFTYISCDHHGSDEIPDPEPGLSRREVDGVGSHFIGIVDEAP
jgi:hypothetical protein